MKRLFDIALTLLAMPLWLPIVAVTALLVLVFEGCPVFFTQERSGLNGRPFRLLKFRSMRNGEGSDAERLTRFGRFLRSSSLDELPELFHVLSGKMSLVGPRPMPVRYLHRYSETQLRRLEVRPGITGLAQINGRNMLSWDEKFRYDVQYADFHPLWLDVKILFKTVAAVFSARGISAEGEATMAEFKGGEDG